MAFTRSEVRNILGDARTDEIENKLVALHLGVVDALKDERDTLKAERDRLKVEADKLPGVQKELDDLKNGEDYKAKYEKEHNDFEAYKTQIANEATLGKVKAAYCKMLTDEKVSEKRLDAIIKVTDFSAMKLDKDGNLENADKLKEGIKKDWGEFIVKTQQRGARVENPPHDDNGGSGMSRARELANRYYTEKYGAPKSADKE